MERVCFREQASVGVAGKSLYVRYKEAVCCEADQVDQHGLTGVKNVSLRALHWHRRQKAQPRFTRLRLVWPGTLRITGVSRALLTESHRPTLTLTAALGIGSHRSHFEGA